MSGYVGKLPRKTAVKNLVVKSIESAVLSVEVYNKPTVKFRTGAYASLMIIAWTSAFHAVFERDNHNYYHKRANGRFFRIDGDKRAFELAECLRAYEGAHLHEHFAANLKLFIRLRNKIEHRQMATLDPYVAPEAQALLLNLKAFLQAEFDLELLGDIGLYVPISVFSSVRSIHLSIEENEVINFINSYRESLDATVWNDTKYAFRAFLIPKIGNHESSSDVTIEFLKLNSLSEAQQMKVSRMASLIRERQMPFKEDLLKPSGIVEKVQERFEIFNMARFVVAWKSFCVRPENGSEDPSQTNSKYCHYDPLDRDYRYEPAFVARICDAMEAGEEFRRVTEMEI